MGEEGWVQGVYGDEPAICYIKQTIGCNSSPINTDNFNIVHFNINSITADDRLCNGSPIREASALKNVTKS